MKAGQILPLLVLIGKEVKAFLPKELADIGLLIEKIDLCLTEAMAFLALCIPCIPAVGAVIYRLQIVGRKTGRLEQAGFGLSQLL